MSDLIKHINAIRNIPVQEDVIKYKLICELIDREGSQFEEKTGKRTEVRHGRWAYKEEHKGSKYGYYYCSICGMASWASKSPYCPNCGSRMDLDEVEK